MSSDTSQRPVRRRARWLVALTLLAAVGGLAWYLIEQHLDGRARDAADKMLASGKPLEWEKNRAVLREVAELQDDRLRLAVLQRIAVTDSEQPHQPFSQVEFEMLARAAIGLDPARRDKAGKILQKLWADPARGHQFRQAHLLATLQPPGVRDSPELVAELVHSRYYSSDTKPGAVALLVGRRTPDESASLARRAALHLLDPDNSQGERAEGVRLLARYLAAEDRTEVAGRVVQRMEAIQAQNQALAFAWAAPLNAVLAGQMGPDADRLRADGLKLLLLDLLDTKSFDPDSCAKAARELAGDDPKSRPGVAATARQLADRMKGNLKFEPFASLARTLFALTEGNADPAVVAARQDGAVLLVERMLAVKQHGEVDFFLLMLSRFKGDLPQPTIDVATAWFQKELVNPNKKTWFENEIRTGWGLVADAMPTRHAFQAKLLKDEFDKKQAHGRTSVAKLRADPAPPNAEELVWETLRHVAELSLEDVAFLHRWLIGRSQDTKVPWNYRIACLQRILRLDLRLTQRQQSQSGEAFADFLAAADNEPLAGEIRKALPGEGGASGLVRLLDLLPRYARHLAPERKGAVVRRALAAEKLAYEGKRTADYLVGLYDYLPEKETDRVVQQLVDRLRRYAALEEDGDNPFRLRMPREGEGKVKVWWRVEPRAILEFLVRLEELKGRVSPQDSAFVVRATLGLLDWERTSREKNLSGWESDILISIHVNPIGHLYAEALHNVGQSGAVLAGNVDAATAHALAGHILETRDGPTGPVGAVFIALLGRVDDTELIDLLKQPRCVGEAEVAVLKELGRRRNQTFHNVWDFVEYVQRTEPGTDLQSPPRRPGSVN